MKVAAEWKRQNERGGEDRQNEMGEEWWGWHRLIMLGNPEGFIWGSKRRGEKISPSNHKRYDLNEKIVQRVESSR